MAEESKAPSSESALKAWLSNDVHKIIVITAAAALVVTSIVVTVVVMLVSSSSSAKAGASAAMASAAKAAKPAAKTGGAVSTATPSAPALDDSAAIRKLEAERQKLLDDQVTMLRQQNSSLRSTAQISAGERDCKLSGDPAKRDDELRSCFGLPSSEAAQRAAGRASAAVADVDNSSLPGLPGGIWGYTGRAAPEYWSVDPRNVQCTSGHLQSPINIIGRFDGGTPVLTFSYRDEPLRMINTGTTIRVNVPQGSDIVVANVPFHLYAIEFHTPSEEWINGRMADMSFDFIHKNNSGQLVVVTVLVNRGVEHPALKALWDWLPDQVGDEQIFPDNRFNPDKILPADRSKYWYYQGSLSSPPCTEPVQHFVLKQSISISDAQFARFTALYSFNARPVQPMYGRVVRER